MGHSALGTSSTLGEAENPEVARGQAWSTGRLDATPRRAHALSVLREPEPQVMLPWLVRLRWLGVLGQAVAVAMAERVFQLGFSTALLGWLVVLAAASNVALSALARPLPAKWSSATLMGAVLTFDTLLLTAL